MTRFPFCDRCFFKDSPSSICEECTGGDQFESKPEDEGYSRSYNFNQKKKKDDKCSG